MILIFTLMGALYLIFLLVAIIAWYRIPSKQPNPVGNLLTISVIIPVRNEATSIQKLLSQLISQNYPNELFEVVVVNDHSTDETKSLVESETSSCEIDMKLINLPASKAGKKAALFEGIISANGEVIVTTDGDCEVSGSWLQTISNTFDDGVKMAFGPVAIKTTNFFSRLQAMDFAALIGLGAATWKLGMMGMCNGANLAFRKSVFQECNGYMGSEQHPSGDDEFLLRKIHQRYPKGIRFIKSSVAMVSTTAQPNLTSFIQQRIRWAGKWRFHKDVATKVVAIFVFLFYALMLGTTAYAFALSEDINIVASIWGVKWVLDVLLVRSVLQLSRQRLPIIESVILSLIYPFYGIFIGIKTINYTFEWKDREY